MRLFRRSDAPPAQPTVPLPAGEEIERAVAATLLQGKAALRGRLFMTNRRLVFEAKAGDARWMIVPFDQVRSAGLYPWAGASMGRPSSRRQCLCIETTAGEQVWWDFGTRDEREWLPLVQARAAEHTRPEESAGTAG